MPDSTGMKMPIIGIFVKKNSMTHARLIHIAKHIISHCFIIHLSFYMFGLYAGGNSVEYAERYARERFLKTIDSSGKVLNKLSTSGSNNLPPLCYQYVKSF